MFAELNPNVQRDDPSFSALSTPHPDFSDSQGSGSSEGLSSFNPYVEKRSLMDENSNLHEFDGNNGVRKPQITWNMVIERKRLAALRSYERLFGGKNLQTVSIQ